jgi:hypothetical protein
VKSLPVGVAAVVSLVATGSGAAGALAAVPFVR